MFMKALVKKAKGKGLIELLDYPIPPVLEGYVLLRIAAAGICGSDLKIYNDDHPYFPPVILDGLVRSQAASFIKIWLPKLSRPK
jgi:threonine dehydrogenase-like Zn-dependent dehydrogenase